MSKPKNRVMCPECGKQKMLFETEKKAELFIKYNGEDIDTKGGVLRPYYCNACCGWHISSKEYKKSYDQRTDKLIDAYHRYLKGKTCIDTVDSNARAVFEYLKLHLKEYKTKSEVRSYVRANYLKKYGSTKDASNTMSIICQSIYDYADSVGYKLEK